MSSEIGLVTICGKRYKGSETFMSKQVFISHSTNDRTIAESICHSLENEGIECWIAPRDIPYGNDWAGEITRAIEASRIFIFVFSKSSNLSTQCPKEINIADSTNIPIICLAIDETEMCPSLRYHLLNSQIMHIDEKEINHVANSLVAAVQYKLKNIVSDNTGMTFLDVELERAFEELFGKGKQQSPTEEESFRGMLNDKISQCFANIFLENNAINSPNESNKSNNNLADDLFDEFGKYQFTSKHTLEGLHFSIINNKGEITVVYRAIDNYDISDFTHYVTFERLDFLEETIEPNKTKRIFFVDIPDLETQITTITFSKKYGGAFVNTGILCATKGTIKLSRKPSFVKIENNHNEGTVKYYTDRSSRQTILLDSESGGELPIKTMIDENGKEETIVELKKSKSYFAFQSRFTETNETKMKMDEETIGDFFMKGAFGFPKNTYNALIWYNKSKTATSYQKMADIFSVDPVFKDEHLAEKYDALASENSVADSSDI